jgi:hypothetical protein
MPKDPIMLLSYVNTELRDHYSSLEEFCSAEGVSAQEIKDRLAQVNYSYDPKTNRFI